MKNGHDIVEVRDLLVTFSRWGQTVRAIDGMCLKIPAGQALIVTGHNGSGKTTLLRALSCLLTPEQGEVFIEGKPAGKLRPADIANAVFHVHQDPLIGSVPTMTVFENLVLADDEAHARRLSKKALAARHRSLLLPLGLAERLQQQAKTLSGGQRQILAILIASLRPAKVILLDEPLAALDAANAGICLKLIGELKNLGKTIVYVTHDLNRVGSFADRIVTLQDGHIVGDNAANKSQR
jgi:ABC-type sugar transport system ATPase subunit